MRNGTHGTTARNGRYTVTEVAELLGITTRAVRKRIEAGRLQAARTPHGWAVQLEAEPPAALEEAAAARAEPVAAPAAPPAELTALRAQVAWFQAEIERRDTAEAELRRLLALALQPRALPEPRDDHPQNTAADPQPRPWWERWRWWWDGHNRAKRV